MSKGVKQWHFLLLEVGNSIILVNVTTQRNLFRAIFTFHLAFSENLALVSSITNKTLIFHLNKPVFLLNQFPEI